MYDEILTEDPANMAAMKRKVSATGMTMLSLFICVVIPAVGRFAFSRLRRGKTPRQSKC